MTRWQQVGIVASWEFRRFIKWRQQFTGLLVMLGIGGIAWGVSTMVAKSRTKPVTVAVIDAGRLGFALPALPRVVWDSARYPTEGEARRAVSEDSIGGALIVQSPTSAELVMRKRASWAETLGPTLSIARRSSAFAQLPLSAEQRASLGDSVSVTLVRISGDGAVVSRETRIFAMIMLALGLMILFNGFATLFIGITGEKQQRITEQMIAMVSPQTWMDGKILGLAGAATVGTAITALGFAVLGRVIPSAFGLPGFSVPGVATEYGVLMLVALVAALGVLMWLSFMAAIAATIDDPNSSSKSMLLFVPMLPFVLAFMLVSRADTTIAQVFSILPLTSMAVLPTRLLTTSVPWWEVASALMLLVGASLVFRRAAGKVFALGVLMHGKEPNVREILRWAREA